jgi:hypothetical protein
MIGINNIKIKIHAELNKPLSIIRDYYIFYVKNLNFFDGFGKRFEFEECAKIKVGIELFNILVRYRYLW